MSVFRGEAFVLCAQGVKRGAMPATSDSIIRAQNH
jgi:hypothetical protein